MVYEEETKLTTMEERKMAWQAELERVEEAIRRWREKPGDKDWVWRNKRDFLWARKDKLEEELNTWDQ